MRLLATIGVVLTVACARPPVGGPNAPLAAGRIGPLALAAFVQDRPAIAGKWYDYNSDTHAQTPKPYAWIVRDTDDDGATRFVAMRIVSIYDDTESGLFTLSFSDWDGSAWGAQRTWVSPYNEKLEGRLCLDVFARSALDCAQGPWQLRLEYFKRFAPQALFFVTDPGLFIRSVDGSDAYGRVRAARVDAQDLSDLPNPTGLAQLPHAPAAAWTTSDWAFGALAPNLPLAGMAVGTRASADDVYFLLSHRMQVVRFTIAPQLDGAFAVSSSYVALSDEDLSMPDKFPAPATTSIAAPTADGARYFRFDSDALEVATGELDDARWPNIAAPTRAYDFAIERVGDEVRVLISPSAAIVNASALGLSEDVPPLE